MPLQIFNKLSFNKLWVVSTNQTVKNIPLVLQDKKGTNTNGSLLAERVARASPLISTLDPAPCDGVRRPHAAISSNANRSLPCEISACASANRSARRSDDTHRRHQSHHINARARRVGNRSVGEAMRSSNVDLYTRTDHRAASLRLFHRM